jgi:hypothetical protein
LFSVLNRKYLEFVFGFFLVLPVACLAQSQGHTEKNPSEALEVVSSPGKLNSQDPRAGAASFKIQSRGPDDPTISRYLEGANQKSFIEKFPYAKFLPDPFFYAQDLEKSQGDRSRTFLVGGLNCDEVIKNAPSLTGVNLETLSLRARGDVLKGQFGGLKKDIRPEWDGVANIWLRSSGDGFLDRRYVSDGYSKDEKQSTFYQLGLKAAKNPSPASLKESQEALRNLLLSDNQAVRNLGLSHQSIAQPLLEGIQSTLTDSEDRPRKTKSGKTASDFEFMGVNYRITQELMGGLVDFIQSSTPLSPEEFAEKKRKQGIPPGNLGNSGWTGRGVQGSFFNDEIFSDHVYKFERLDSEGKVVDTLTIDGMTPHLIYRYGFYQGGDYRTPPEKIAKFFKEMQTKAPPNLWAPCGKK